MRTLEENNLNLHGEKAKLWLENLPQIVNRLAKLWGLNDIQAFDNLTWNYVARAKSKEHGPVVIKVSLDESLIHDEILCLKHFNGQGMVRFIAHDLTNHALLMQQISPGHSLRSLYKKDVKQTIDEYANVIKQLITVKTSDDFKPVEQWLKAFERTANDSLPIGILEKAKFLCHKLLANTSPRYSLHGDLHHDNIICDGNIWLAIDPKGISGPLEFEAAAFDFITEDELTHNNVRKLFDERTQHLAQAINCDVQSLRDWIYIRLILSICWFIEDNGDPEDALNQLSILYGDIRY